MNNGERAQKICELLKIVLFGLTCPFVLPLVVENDRAEVNESSEPTYPKTVNDIRGVLADPNETLSHGPEPSSFVINADVCDDKINSPNVPISNVGHLYFVASNQRKENNHEVGRVQG